MTDTETGPTMRSSARHFDRRPTAQWKPARADHGIRRWGVQKDHPSGEPLLDLTDAGMPRRYETELGAARRAVTLNDEEAVPLTNEPNRLLSLLRSVAEDERSVDLAFWVTEIDNGGVWDAFTDADVRHARKVIVRLQNVLRTTNLTLDRRHRRL
ncbi:hypothetical protein [Agromyces humi]|uniref:hypothetical protein n=1 Tax=Agromyces humi TaxID=1766800 RepID=UPI00135B951A|nr:hypothetical protein [Agromyces humi]